MPEAARRRDGEPVAGAHPARGRDPAADSLELFRLLAGVDRARLHEAIRRLEDRAAFVDHLSTVLADAMRVGASRDKRFGDALAPVIAKGVHETVRRDPGSFGKAVAPALGPAIRGAVAQMFRGLMESVERALEQTMSPRSWRWRYEAWRTGKPLAEIVFLRTLKYRAEHVFLIHRETGLLLARASNRGAAGRDPDLISAMLTAIQDFVHDAFEGDGEQSLEAFRVGDLTVWVEHAPHALLAVVVRGPAPQSERVGVREVLDELQLEYSEQLVTFAGDAAAFDGAATSIERCLFQKELEERPPRRSRWRRWLVPAGAAVVAALLITWWVASWIESSRWHDFVAVLRAEPGIALTHSGHSGGKYRLVGLRDPFAIDPVALASRHGLDPAEVDARFQPYHSAEPAFVLRRLRRALAPPDAVTMALVDGRLVLGGRAPGVWIARVRELAPVLPGVDAVDTGGLIHDDR